MTGHTDTGETRAVSPTDQPTNQVRGTDMEHSNNPHTPRAPECDQRAYIHGSAERAPDPAPEVVNITYTRGGERALADAITKRTAAGWDPDADDHLAVAEAALNDALARAHRDPHLLEGHGLTVRVSPPADGSPREKAQCVRDGAQVIHNVFGGPTGGGAGVGFPGTTGAGTVERLAAETVADFERIGYMPMAEVAATVVTRHLKAGHGPAHTYLVPVVERAANHRFISANQAKTGTARVDCEECGASYEVRWGAPTDCPVCAAAAEEVEEWGDDAVVAETAEANRRAAEKAIRNPWHLPPGTAPDGHFPLPVMGRVPGDE